MKPSKLKKSKALQACLKDTIENLASAMTLLRLAEKQCINPELQRGLGAIAVAMNRLEKKLMALRGH